MYHWTQAHLSGEKKICEEERSLTKTLIEPGKESVELPSGVKNYPFKFTLFNDIPSSFEGTWGNIRYELKASIETTNEGETKHESSVPLSVKEIIDANGSLYAEGFTANAYKDLDLLWCVNPDAVELSGSVDRACYLPGDIILINAHVENYSNKKLKCLKAKLCQKVRYHYKKKTLIEERGVAKVASASIPKGENFVWKNEPLAVPDIPPNMYCELIEIKHSLKLQVNGLTAEIPIIIGTIPFNKSGNTGNMSEGVVRLNGRKVVGVGNDMKRPLLYSDSTVDENEELAELSRCSTY